jgi:hypothetical protein
MTSRTCKFVKITTEMIPGLGGGIPNTEVKCRVKMHSEQLQRSVYEKLFQLGFEGQFISDICPVAHSGNWSACPYREL